MTASAPCSMVSLILSCFSSLREICSDTHALLIGLECLIVAQVPTRRRVRKASREHGLTASHEIWPLFSKALRMVLTLECADGVHSLRRGSFAEGRASQRPFKGAVQVFKMRENDNCGDQAARGFHGGHVATSLLCEGKRHEFEFEFATARSGSAAA